MGRMLLGLIFVLSLEAVPKRVLFLTHSAGFRHGSIEVARRVMAEVAQRSGKLDVVSTEDLTLLAPERLREFDVLFFFTSGELALTPEQKSGLLEFVREGKGFGGAHSATDTLYTWPEYGDLIGGYFDGHPWTQEAGVDIEDPDHPASRHLAPSFRILEEFYQFRSWSRESVRVLMTLDTTTIDPAAQGVNRTDGDFALAWVRQFGRGRVFYTALGHFDETWLHPGFQKTLEQALLWLSREVDGDAAPRRATPSIARVSNLGQPSDGVITPGRYLVVSGDGLTSGSTAVAATRPAKLAGTQVLISGKPAALVLVTPRAVVAEAPADLGEEGTAEVLLISGSVDRSEPRTVLLSRE
jgi:type 1 glutamine amidotransferase